MQILLVSGVQMSLTFTLTASPTFETTILNHVAVPPEYESKSFSKTHYNRNLLIILQVSN